MGRLGVRSKNVAATRFLHVDQGAEGGGANLHGQLIAVRGSQDSLLGFGDLPNACQGESTGLHLRVRLSQEMPQQTSQISSRAELSKSGNFD